jgi:RNA polymerase sigma-70 factor (ECF subfamily)
METEPDTSMIAHTAERPKNDPPGPRGDDDASIERAIARGDHREALGMCARAYGRAVGRLCMAFTGSQAEADELAQEALLAAHDAFGSYRGDGSVRAFVFGIARRICARHGETRARREARLSLVHDADRAAPADEVAIARQQAARARAALAELKPTEREAVLLRFEAGLSFREVAAACGIDEPTARKRVSRALERMRRSLGDDGA